MRQPWKPPPRAAFIARAMNLVGVPYLWGGKTHQGIDCSGLVTLALWECGACDWRLTHHTDRMWMELPATTSPLPGDLVFYGGSGPLDVSHVMVWLPPGVVFGASGGDSGTRSLAEAMRRGAKVRAYDRVVYRTDIRGMRSLSSFLI